MPQPHAYADRTPLRWLLLLTLFAFETVPAQAATVRKLAIPALAAKSDLVVLATVTEMHTYRSDDGRVLTESTLRPQEWLRGSPTEDEIVVRQWGGAWGGAIYTLPGDARWHLDDTVMVFLRHGGTNPQVVYLTALAQASFRAVGSAPEGDLLLWADLSTTHFISDMGTPYLATAQQPIRLSAMRQLLNSTKEAAR